MLSKKSDKKKLNFNLRGIYWWFLQ